MRKLLSANVSRLWSNKPFWLTAVIMIVAESLLCLLFLQQGSLPMEFVLFISLQGIGVLTSVFYSLFLGTEYSDGTIRNKLVVGHTRSSIYLSSFITGIIAVSIIYLAGLLTGGVIGAVSNAIPATGIGQLAFAGVIGWLACISYAAIFNLIGMLSTSKAKTSVLSILTAFILVFFGLTCYSLARPGLLSASKAAIFQFLFDFNPYGQTFQLLSVDIASLWKLAVYALLLISILTGVGLYVFRKKDLK